MPTVLPSPRESEKSDDGGFVLLESLVTIALITVIMTALTTFFITAMSSTSRQRAQQSATQIANSAVETGRGLGAGGVVLGRVAGAAEGQFVRGRADGRVQPWLAEMTPAFDTAAAAGAVAALSTDALPQIINGITYQVDNYVGWCWRSIDDTAAPDSCTGTATTGALRYVRLVVAVTWPDTSCSTGRCVYLTATLLNGTTDPLFNFRSAPPAPPTITCAAQASAAEETIDRSILATSDTPGCVLDGGVPPYTYAVVGLPAGLAMDGAGTVTGAATTPGASNVTMTVTDSFLRRVSAAPFVWTVSGPLIVTSPGTQNAIVNQPITPVTLSASGGAGGPYTWTATALPPGLTLDAATGRVTGTPTQLGTTSVVLTVTDKAGSTHTADPFAWTVVNPPLSATTPADRVTQVGTAQTVPLVSSGGSGGVTWSDPGATLPTGTRIQGSQIVGTVTTRVLKRQVSLTATDSDGQTRTVSFRWTVDDGALVADSVGNRVTVVNEAVPPFVLTASGGYGPYTYSDPTGSLPPGVTITAGGTISGTPTGTQPRRAVSIRVADAGTRTATVSFLWTVDTGPIAGDFPDRFDVVSRALVAFRPTVSGGSAPYTFSDPAGSLPAGITLASDGTFSGTPSVRVARKPVTVTVSDGGGRSKVFSFRWTVDDGPLIVGVVGDRTSTLSQAITAFTPSTSGGTAPYTWADPTGSLPPGITLAANGTFSGTPTQVVTNQPVTVTVTDSGGRATQLSFRWTVNSRPTVTSPGDRTFNPGEAVSVSVARTCGSTPCTVAVSAGALPAGLSLNASTGVISGTPSTAGTSSGIVLRITDAAGAQASSAAFTWTVGAQTCAAAAQSVGQADTYFTYPLRETAGRSATDISGNNRNGTFTPGGVTYNVAGPCARDTPNGAVTFDGSTGYLTGAAQSNPQTFTVETWFKNSSTTTRGGKLIGFGSNVTGPSIQQDRHVYLDSNGRLRFGVYNNAENTVTASTLYTDTNWHHVVASLSPTAGIALYVDGALADADPNVRTAETYDGFWRIGYDQGWAEPKFFIGSMAYTSVYTTVLSAAQVRQHYQAALPAFTAATPADRVSTVGQAQTVNLTSSGGSGQVVWSDPGTTLPAGLSIQGKQIVGTPTAPVTNQLVSLTATDSAAGQTRTVSFRWTVNSRPTVTSPGDRTFNPGEAVSVSVARTCGSTPCTVAVSAGALPAGLSLNASTGVISGTPSTAGTSSGIVLRITDAAGAQASSAAFTWTVGAQTCAAAAQSVGQADTYFTYPLRETAGRSATDISGNNRNGTFTPGGVTYNVAGPCARDTPNGAVTFDGSTGYLTGAAQSNPQTFTVETWFKNSSTTTRGGKLIGFGSNVTGPSIQQDRHVYLDSNGRLRFGVYNNAENTVTASTLYTDTNWHHVVASLSPTAGIALYVDGALADADPNVRTAETYDGFWRIGYDQGWAEPRFFIGSMAYTSVYTTVLSAAQVRQHYQAALPAFTAATPADRVSTVGQAQTVNLASSGGSGQVVWSDPGTTLPAGLSIQGSQIVGTPTAPVTNQLVSLTATDSAAGQTRTVSFRWTVNPRPTVTSPGNQTSNQGTPGSVSVVRTCGSTPCTVAVSAGALPAGLSLNASTGVISGTPSIAGTSSGIVLRITDATGAQASSAAFTWTVANPTCAAAYQSVGAANTEFIYPLRETAGPGAADSSGNNRTGTFTPAGVAYGTVAGPCIRDTPNQAVTFDGQSGYLTGPQRSAPAAFTIETWFKNSSATTRGGKLIGYGSSATGQSANNDRHLYLSDSGSIYFGVYPNGARTVNTSTLYTDTNWHHVVATLSPTDGMKLYVDGALAATDPNTTTAQSYTGYWRIGYDKLYGWPNAPTSSYFRGSMAYTAVYSTVLTGTDVTTHYTSALP